jgi:uncharacterized protein with ParB-like and HNH nuclease domain
LWEDIEFIHENVDEYHYMGYLVLQEKEDSVFSVIDGQQRFTTFSLIVLAAIKRLKEINDEERANLLLRTFIGTEDLTYLTIENKLTLNRNNDYYYNQAVSGQPIPKRSKTLYALSSSPINIVVNKVFLATFPIKALIFSPCENCS